MPQRRVLIIGGSFAGLCGGRDLADHFKVTIIDAKEFFEYTPGILRAYVKPKHFDALSFNLQPVIETRMNCRFIWGEVLKLDGPNKTATYKPMFQEASETIDFDYCLIAAGCNFGVFHKWGESLWFPTVHAEARLEGSWSQFDERFVEGRRRHILDEYKNIQALENRSAKILVVGAGFIGVEWATELQHFFPKLGLTILDALPRSLGPLPESAKDYCEKYMKKVGINQVYSLKYAPKDPEFWKKLNLPNGADKEYICVGVKASNYFMPPETLSERGPGGGKWIYVTSSLAVGVRPDPQKAALEPWVVDQKGYPRIFAIGDCNYGCVEEDGKRPAEWKVPPIPKISYPGEEEMVIACRNIMGIDAAVYDGYEVNCLGQPVSAINELHWPWGAGMFATSLGPDDACFVAGANWKPGSGWLTTWGQLSAVQKEIIEASKVDECRFGVLGRLIWHFVHHTPFHFWGRGPFVGYWPW